MDSLSHTTASAQQAALLDPADVKLAEATSLPAAFLTDLTLRHFARLGELKLFQISQHLGMAVPVVDALLTNMRKLGLLEVPRRGDLEGDVSYALTETGQRLARLSFEKCNYVGPAPVTLPEYVARVGEQSRHLVPVRAAHLKQAMGDLVIEPAMLPTLGSALNSGKAIYLYGESGSGKTYLAEHLINTLEGHIWVPHAIYVDGEVIQVLDPIVHHLVPEAEPTAPGLTREAPIDGRWALIERPVVIAGGELTLDMLDLNYDPHTRLHVAPPQMKANNGIFVIDDFGRQRVSPHELMNRWIVPLDRRVDYLALNTGTKFTVPFDVHVVFSSNLAPEELVDPAFARRLGYKIHVLPMNAEAYRAVVAQACARSGVPPDPAGIDYLVNTLHQRHGQPYLPNQPFDVISKIADRAKYLEEAPRMTPEVLDWAWATYFGGNSLPTQADASPTFKLGD
jgi:predicted ATPase with chaperone activity